MKKLTFIIVAALLWQFSAAQKAVTTYYDWNKIHPHEKYTINSAGQKNGPYKEYNQDGVVIAEANYVNGVANGPCSTYWAKENNQRSLAAKSTYKNGEFNGPYASYDETGIPLEQGNYVNGKKLGKWTRIEELTDLDIPNKPEGFKFVKVEVEMKDGHIPDGMYKIYYYPSGKLRGEGWMKNEERTSQSILYYPNGNLQTKNLVNAGGDLFISKESWYPSGKIKYYQTFHNDYRNNIWFTDDTLWDYNEDGIPTAYMKEQAELYEVWKMKAHKSKAAEDEENKRTYPIVLADADSLYVKGNYENARAKYLKASSMMNDNGYAKAKANEVDSIIKGKELAEKEVQDKKNRILYQKFLEEGDSLFGHGIYADAETAYMKASQSMEDKGYATKKLNEVKAAEENKKKLEYQRIISEADELFAKGNFIKARSTYSEAALVMDDNGHALSKINEVKAAEVERQRQMEKQANDLDTLYNKFNSIFTLLKPNPFLVDANHNPIMKMTYPKGENLFSKCDVLIKHLLIEYRNTEDYQAKNAKGKYIINALYNLIALENAKTKDLDKQMKNADSDDEVKRILGI